jgi:hypothetical protein
MTFRYSYIELSTESQQQRILQHLYNLYISTYKQICQARGEVGLSQDEQATFVHRLRRLIILDNFSIPMFNPDRRRGLS